VLAVSPSLNWDDDLPLRQAGPFLADREELNATLFVAMANEEEGDPKPTRLDRLEETLTSTDVPGFEVQVMRMPDETHGSVVLRAHYWGLRKVFEGWTLPRDPMTGVFAGSLTDLKAHYKNLSARFGFEVMAPELVVNQVGYQFLLREDIDDAIKVFRYNVELYPGSANVYDSLGEAQERAGSPEEAADNYAKAVVNATAIGDQRLDVFTTNRDRVNKQLENAAGDRDSE